ncbi:type II secretion system protein [Ruminobacter sp.]|uniref:type II secretion system protein n=1 Tax=Ruminobacter sp. TaxID=2774296 RepID=UPI0038650FD8
MKNKGFTLIELVVVIIILGILSASAAPKFMNLKSEARAATLTALAGSLKSANNMFHAKALAQGLTSSTESYKDQKIYLTINGVKYNLKFGYVDRNNVGYLVDGSSAIPPAAGQTAAARSDKFKCSSMKTACEYDWCDCFPGKGDELEGSLSKFQHGASENLLQLFIPNGYVPANYKKDQCFVAYRSAHKLPANTGPVYPSAIRVFADGC